MSIYTLAELEIEITTYKAALSTLATAKSTQIGDQRIDRQDIPTLRDHLAWLESQRATLQNTGGTAPTLAGRTFATNSRER